MFAKRLPTSRSAYTGNPRRVLPQPEAAAAMWGFTSSANSKQSFAEEGHTEDDPRLEKVARAMASAKTPQAHAPPASVWDQWVASQLQMADHHASMKERVEEARRRRPKSARVDLDPNRFNSTLASGSGFTNTGRKATESRLRHLADAAEREQEEVAELKTLLGKTLYTGGGNTYKRAGSVATASLMKLDDGQKDDIVTLRNRRIAEEQAAVAASGRPMWDASPHRPTPPALKGCLPNTPEPWAADAAAYEDGMASHGFKAIDTGAEDAGYKKSRGKKVAIQNVATVIQSDMVAYRRELGAAKKAPVSARHLRAWSDAGSMPASARTSGSARTGTGRSTGRSFAPRT